MKGKKLLAAAVMCLSVVSLASCNSTKLSGTELAKILLAQERLDSENVKNTGNLFTKGVKALKRIESEAKEYNDNARRLANRKEKPRTEVDGNTIRWYNDEEYSNMGSYFESYSNNIESMAKQSGDLIDYVKKNVRVTDKWIGTGTDKVLLQVDSESETIFEVMDGQYRICRRSTNEHGLDVYDMFMHGEEHDSKTRMKYIPGQVYEFAMSADWATYYLIAHCFDNEWTVMTNTRRYGTGIDEPGIFNENFDIISLKDDIGLRTDMSITEFGVDNRSREDFTPGGIKLISADAKLDLFDMATSHNFTIKNTAVNGIDYFEHTGTITEDHLSIDADILKLGNNYSSITPPKVVLKNGTTLKNGDLLLGGKMQVVNINIGNFAGMEAVGEITIQVLNEAEPSSKFAYLYEFMDAYGLTFKREKDAILAVEPFAETRATNFINNFRWNGYSLNTKENIIKVFDIEDQKIADLMVLYENVKDNPSITKSSQAALDKNAVLPNTILTKSDAYVIDGKVIVKEAGAEIDSFEVLESWEKYTLGLGLAKKENDQLVDFMTLCVSPNWSSSSYVPEEKFEIGFQSGTGNNFDLPVLEEQGTYVLAVAIVTADGIRISKPVELTVNSFIDYNDSKYGYLNSYKFVNNTLQVEVSLDTSIYLEIDKEVSLTYLRNEMVSYAIQRGDVIDNSVEQLVNGNWVVVKDTNSLSNGQYRMKYVYNDKDEYVYTTILLSQ